MTHRSPAAYAPMLLSASAKPVTTDANGLAAGMQRIPARDAVLPAYVAQPKGGSKRPVVIVVPEVWGLHEYIRDVCRRLAKEGYVAMLAYSKGDLKNARRYFETAPYIDRTWLEYSVIDTWRRAADTQG